MWVALYESASGRLISLGTVVVSPLPAGVATLALPGPPDFSTTEWNAASRTFVARPARVVQDRIAAFMADPDITALTSQQRTRVQAAAARIFGDPDVRYV